MLGKEEKEGDARKRRKKNGMLGKRRGDRKRGRRLKE